MTAIWTLKVGENIISRGEWDAPRIRSYSFHKHTWRELPPRAGPLEDGVEEDKNLCWHKPLEKPHPEVGQRERLFNFEVQLI
jgi:hypothetical protein